MLAAVSTIDRCLASMIRQRADAVVFNAGDRPRFYLDGKSVPIAQYPQPLSRADVAGLASIIIPAAQLESQHSSARFPYGQVSRIEAVFEQSPDSCRLTFWNRGK